MQSFLLPKLKNKTSPEAYNEFKQNLSQLYGYLYNSFLKKYKISINYLKNIKIILNDSLFCLYNDFLHNNGYNINVGKHLSLQYMKKINHLKINIKVLLFLVIISILLLGLILYPYIQQEIKFEMNQEEPKTLNLQISKEKELKYHPQINSNNFNKNHKKKI